MNNDAINPGSSKRLGRLIQVGPITLRGEEVYPPELIAAARANAAKAVRTASISTDENAVLAWLMSGTVHADHCFLAGDTFCVWSPEQRELIPMTASNGDPAVREAYRADLRQRGAAFGSIEEVRAEVNRRRLPGTDSVEPSRGRE